MIGNELTGVRNSEKSFKQLFVHRIQRERKKWKIMRLHHKQFVEGKRDHILITLNKEAFSNGFKREMSFILRS